jgi:hypothetical protein
MVRPGDFRLKRMALMAGVIGGVALLLAACGGGSGSDQVSNITTSTPTPPSAKCPVPGGIPEHLRQWAEMCDEWDPVRIDPQLLGAFNTGVLTRQDVEAIARTLKDLEIAKRLAMLTLDLSWLEKVDVVTDARMKVVRERIWPLLVERDREIQPVVVGRYSPTIVSLLLSAQGLVVVVERCPTDVSAIDVNITTGDKITQRKHTQVANVTLIKANDGSYRVDDEREVPNRSGASGTEVTCAYSTAVPIP